MPTCKYCGEENHKQKDCAKRLEDFPELNKEIPNASYKSSNVVDEVEQEGASSKRTEARDQSLLTSCSEEKQATTRPQA